MEDEKWDVEITYKVVGKEPYEEIRRWHMSPKKVKILMHTLMEAEVKFLKAVGAD